MNDFETYEAPRHMMLGSQLADLLRPDRVGKLEAAVWDGESYGFSESVCRLIETEEFKGCVAADYTNDDPNRNPGYERGTRTRLVVAGTVGSRLLHYMHDPDEAYPGLLVSHYLEDSARLHGTHELASTAMEASIAALRAEANVPAGRHVRI